MTPVENASIRLKPYRLREAAEAVGIPYETIRDAVRRGEVPHSKIGKIVLIPAPYVARVLNGGQ